MPAPGFEIVESSSTGSISGASADKLRPSTASGAPPGFTASSSGSSADQDARDRLPPVYRKADSSSIDNGRRKMSNSNHHGMQHHRSAEPHQHREDVNTDSSHQGTSASHHSHSSAPAPSGGGRTSSFVDLAAVVGTGLAESMDDFQPSHLGHSFLLPPQHPQSSTSSIGGGHHYPDSNNNALQDLNFARQSRHAAARLIGASPPRVDPLGLDAGSFNGGGNAAPAPATLALVGIGGGSNSVSGGTTTRYNSTTSSHDQFLTGSFVTGGGGGTGGPSNDGEGAVIAAEASSDRKADFKVELQQRNAESFLAGNNRRSHLPVTKDLGLTVMEPTEQWQRQIELAAVLQQQQHQCPQCNDVPMEPWQHRQPQNEMSSGGLAAMLQQQHHQCPQCSDNPSGSHWQHRQLQKDGGGGGGLAAILQQPQNSCPQCHHEDAFEVEQGMRRLWVDDVASGGGGRNSHQRQQQQQHLHQSHLDRSLGNSSTRSGGTEASRQIAEAELRPFCWDTRGSRGNTEPSRCLAILQAHRLQVPDIRSTCEAFGVLESFRTDFSERGIIFVGYHDIRSAQYAALELEGVLQRLARGSDCAVSVQYCVPLNSSAQTDESRIILTDLPPYVDEHSLLPMLSSYGAIRTLKREGGYYGGSSFEVEFHNVQDAKQALLELSSTQPWGPDVGVEVGTRPAVDRKRGRELLSMIGRWRHGHGSRSVGSSEASPASAASRNNPYMTQATRVQNVMDLRQGPESYNSSSSPHRALPTEGTTTQLVLGPDGRYSYMVVNNQPSGFSGPSNYGGPHPRNPVPPHHQAHQHHPAVEPQRQQQQQIFHGPDGRVYITTIAGPNDVPTPAQHATTYRTSGGGPYWQPQNQPQQQSRPYQSGSTIINTAPYRDHQDRGPPAPYYTQGVPQVDPPRHPHRQNQYSGGSGSGVSGGCDDKDNKLLMLDLDAVEAGRDTRTSLMVRNIPNKYTQQMLLNEFTENGLGPGVIDFFYLPIDFKNRCNRGYAFINFVDCKDILPFHRRYYGKHWSTFNSEKICEMTYARIQGKAAMLKRFENSALMEKDEEYKPLVFDRGMRVPFPVSGQR